MTIADQRSLALHREVARRLRQDRSVLEAARRRVESWRRFGGAHPRYAERWRAILERPVAEIIELLTDQSPEASTLRSVSPFAGALDPRTRWRILRELSPPKA